MRKPIFVVITTLASAAVVAVGTSAFAVAIAPPDVNGQVQDLPSIISGTWSPVEFDLTSTVAGGPVEVAGPVAEPIGQQAKEGPTTDDSGDSTGQDGETGSDLDTPADGSSQAPAEGSGDDAKAEKVKKDKKDTAAKEAEKAADKAAKEAQKAEDKAAKDAEKAEDKAAKEAKKDKKDTADDVDE